MSIFNLDPDTVSTLITVGILSLMAIAGLVWKAQGAAEGFVDRWE